jgi:release factor glutamine methyltransferase
VDVLTWSDLWASCTDRLGSTDEARWLLEEASGRSGASWLLVLDATAPLAAQARVEEMILRRLSGEPLQYVLGNWAFRHLNLHVDRRVLIPRPETEQVTQAAMDAIAGIDDVTVVDLGTGSGAIALSVALEVEQARVHAVDISDDALEVARTNRLRLPDAAQARVEFHRGSWFDALPEELRGNVDLVISNPPYIAGQDTDIESSVLQWEPESALFSDGDGLGDIGIIISGAASWLSAEGTLVVEIGAGQGVSAVELAREAGFSSVEVGADLAGRDRWIVAKRAPLSSRKTTIGD